MDVRHINVFQKFTARARKGNMYILAADVKTVLDEHIFQLNAVVAELRSGYLPSDEAA